MSPTGDDNQKQRDDAVRQAEQERKRRAQVDLPPPLDDNAVDRVLESLGAPHHPPVLPPRRQPAPTHRPVEEDEGEEAAGAPQAGGAEDGDTAGGPRWGTFSDRFKRELANLQAGHQGDLSREQEQQMRQEAARRAKSRPMQPLKTDHVELGADVTQAIQGLAGDDAALRERMLGNAKEAIAGGLDEQDVLDEVGRLQAAMDGQGEGGGSTAARPRGYNANRRSIPMIGGRRRERERGEQDATHASAAEGGGAGEDLVGQVRAAVREEIQQALPALAREIARQLTVN